VRHAAEPRHSIDRAPAETALSPDGIVRATSCGHVDGALTVGGQKASWRRSKTIAIASWGRTNASQRSTSGLLCVPAKTRTNLRICHAVTDSRGWTYTYEMWETCPKQIRGVGRGPFVFPLFNFLRVWRCRSGAVLQCRNAGGRLYSAKLGHPHQRLHTTDWKHTAPQCKTKLTHMIGKLSIVQRLKYTRKPRQHMKIGVSIVAR